MLIISIITIILAVLIALAAIFKRHNRLTNVVFSASLLAIASLILGNLMVLHRPEYVVEGERIVFISEAVMAVTWLLFSLSFARTDYWQTVSRVSKFFVYLSPLIIIGFISLPIEDFLYLPEVRHGRVLFLRDAGYVFNILLLFYAILSIINLEATLRSSKRSDRGIVKYTILGVGGIISINIFYYSNALLYRSINMYLFPVRTGIILISVLLIGFSLFRHKALDTEFSVSRKVLYKSVSLITVGGYLLGMGLIGEGMRHFGPEAGKNITTFIGAAGAILLIAVMFSEQLRSRAKVFINKNFFSQKYDYREQWLQFTKRISLKHSFDELLSSITEGFKDALGAKGAAIWLREMDNGKYHCVRALNSPVVDTQPDKDLLEFFMNLKWILDVRHNKCEKVVSSNKIFIEKTRASLIVPLLDIDRLIGFIILEDGLAEAEYNFEDYDLLRTLSRQAVSAILNARLSDELTKAKEMEAMGRLSSFILHDLKNATSMLSLIVQNAGEHIENPDFQRDAIKAVSNTSEKINAIIGKLKNLPRKTSLDLEYYDLGSYVKITIHELNLNGNTELSFKELEPVMAMFDKEEISKVIINLILNALEATNHKGKVEVVVGTENNMGFVRVSDNGCGMSSEFIENKLFRPFQTTKKKGLGIGLYQCKSIIEAHSGMLKVESREGRGSDFSLYLPLKFPQMISGR